MPAERTVPGTGLGGIQAILQAELEQEIARVQGELDPAAVALTSIEVKPRKTDTVVSEVALVWQGV